MIKNVKYTEQKVNIDLFFGKSRFELIETIVEASIAVESLGLRGGRGMGKTTLLERAKSEVELRGLIKGDGGLRVIPVLVNFLKSEGSQRSATTIDPLEFIWDQVVTSCIDYGVIESPYSINHQSIYARFRQLFESMEIPTTILLLLDNVDQLLKLENLTSFADNFRALISDEPGVRENLCAVLAGAKELHRITQGYGSPLANVLRWHSLELFNEEDTYCLVNDPVSLPPNREFACEVYQLTGGHPFIIQYLLKNVKEERTLVALDSAAEEFKREKNLFRYIWQEQFDRRVRMAYAELERYQAGLTKELIVQMEMVDVDWVDYVVDCLCHHGVARCDEGRVELVGNLFKTWFGLSGRYQILPPAEQDLRNLILDHLEPLLRKFCDDHLAHTKFKNCKGWKKNHPGKKKDLRVFFGNYFEIMNNQFELFKSDLSAIGNLDANELNKKRVKLVDIRNKLCHPNDTPIGSEALKDAKHEVLQLIDCLNRCMS